MADFKRRVRNAQKVILRKLFECGQRCGFDILPRHFYSEIPSIRDLKETAHWKEPYSMIGVNGADIDSQLDYIQTCCAGQLIERQKQGDIYKNACDENGEAGFGPIESDLLHCFVATHKPSQVLQIGCGVSTAVILRAAEETGYRPEVTCVDPFPTRLLQTYHQQGLIRLVDRKIELCEVELRETLGASDFLFIDSTHTLGPAGEVSRMILEMLPRLPENAVVHLHDVYFPYDYSPDILTQTLFFWHETVLLHAFLACNPRFRILASLAMLHHACPAKVVPCLPNYAPAPCRDGLLTGPGHFPSSVYLKVTG